MYIFYIIDIDKNLQLLTNKEYLKCKKDINLLNN